MGAGPGCESSEAPVGPGSADPPNPAQTAPRRGWHKGKDKFQNAGPPTCGNSNCLWLPDACHQGTTCCPLGCLAKVAAARHFQPRAQGKEKRDREGGSQVLDKGPHTSQAAEQEERPSTVERQQAGLEGHRLWSHESDSRLSHLSVSDFGQAA